MIDLRRGDCDRLLIIIDAFEELFTQADPAAQEAMFATLDAPRRSIDTCALLLAMRADFYDRLMASPLWPIGQVQRLELASLGREALVESIRQPAAELGVRVDPLLIERLCAHTDKRQPGVLPMLQEALRRLWEKMSGRLLTLAAYEALCGSGHDSAGGLVRAVEIAVDAAIYEKLTPAQQRVARRILLPLVNFGEGAADTRRQVAESELRTASESETDFQQTLKVLTASRLLTLRSGDVPDSSNDPRAAERRVALSHEALLIDWKTLRPFVAERGAAEQQRRRMEERAKEWARRGRGRGSLLDATELPE